MKADATFAHKMASVRGARSKAGHHIPLDTIFMATAIKRLSLFERGLIMRGIERAARARRPTVEQKALLALFVPYQGGEHV